MFVLHILMRVSDVHGNVRPDRALTAEMSDELIAPDAFTSNLKFAPVVVWPERAFTALISLELTERVLFTSPTRKPIDTGLGFTVPLTPVRVSVMRLLSASDGIVTVTVASFPGANADAPRLAPEPSTTAIVPEALMVLLNWNMMV